jgi:phospholipase/lecithinase/hemolysin
MIWINESKSAPDPKGDKSMANFKVLAATFSAALLVAACGGGGDGNQTPRVAFTSVVSFGDSLSDVGTYRVGPIAAAGGGRFTVNPSVVATPTIWPEFVAAQLGLSSCAARVGGFGSTETAVTGCRNYAQGGARVQNPKGVGNPVGVGFIAGPLTEPVVTQLANYAADNGSANFTDKQLVTVLAGANDIFGLADDLTAAATAAGNAAFAQSLVGQFVAGAPAANQAAALGAIGLAVQTEASKPTATAATIVTAAATAAATHAAMNAYTNSAVANAAAIGATAGAAAVTAGNTYAATTGAAIAVAGMTTAGTTLAGYVKDKIVANGAKYVAVSNLPDVSLTPSAASSPSTQPLVLAMTMAFNKALQDGLAGTPGVVIIDAFANLQDQVAHPERYNLTNVTTPACAVSSSLTCTASTLIAGDTSHYLFADGVHPTPYVHKLQAQLVLSYLVKAGWL